MPWFALPFRNNVALFARYGIPYLHSSWPKLVLLSPDDVVIFDDASAIVRQSVQERKPHALAALFASNASTKTTAAVDRFEALLMA